MNCLLWNADNVSLPQGWAPPCSGTAAVVLIPCSAGVVTHQPTIAQVPMASTPGGCNCSVSQHTRKNGGCQELLFTAVRRPALGHLLKEPCLSATIHVTHVQHLSANTV